MADLLRNPAKKIAQSRCQSRIGFLCTAFFSDDIDVAGSVQPMVTSAEPFSGLALNSIPSGSRAHLFGNSDPQARKRAAGTGVNTNEQRIMNPATALAKGQIFGSSPDTHFLWKSEHFQALTHSSVSVPVPAFF